MATEEIKTAEAGDKPKRGRDKRERRDGGDGREKSPYIERVVFINRVAKVVSGGRRFSFTALVVLGDGNGTVGVGYGKAKEFHKQLRKLLKKRRSHSSKSHVFREQFLTQYKVKMLPA